MDPTTTGAASPSQATSTPAPSLASTAAPRKVLHSKRSFGTKHSLAHNRPVLDSPAYDASEEDNDPLTDDGASSVSSSVPHHPRTATARPAAVAALARTTRPRHALAASVVSSDDGGLDSPTYDGDVESITTTRGQGGRDTPSFPGPARYASSIASTLASPFLSSAPLHDSDDPGATDAPTTDADADPRPRSHSLPHQPPPVGRPVRVYSDGVYDLFHFGHALQLRQAKLAFPPPPDAPEHVVSGVHLLVGVNSDEQCEAVRHCRWVDEIIPDAPWVLDAAFIEKIQHQIDYVAHDEDPYASGVHDDVYAFVKNAGKFLPTRRTPGVSTSELLERIVSGYRLRVFDKKLIKMGHPELKAEGSDYDDSAPPSGRVSPPANHMAATVTLGLSATVALTYSKRLSRYPVSSKDPHRGETQTLVLALELGVSRSPEITSSSHVRPLRARNFGENNDLRMRPRSYAR
ncbi:uncharacterized protein BXZ73DRAFT_79735 [Epithele typhae]|uniref:uncharacterized protein n=1 Tax=Epithele typhae TaxID=378194 RepID=UPI002008B32B|nr:uncharacterized protein BXZ73DRAFT_79735 [Epithele typhae]KAH9922341.1 hypothetical protein BXZ73DRAFT_79735 [Epithele typhae]